MSRAHELCWDRSFHSVWMQTCNFYIQFQSLIHFIKGPSVRGIQIHTEKQKSSNLHNFSWYWDFIFSAYHVKVIRVPSPKSKSLILLIEHKYFPKDVTGYKESFQFSFQIFQCKEFVNSTARTQNCPHLLALKTHLRSQVTRTIHNSISGEFMR